MIVPEDVQKFTRGRWLAGSLLALYLLIVCAQASLKLIWADELFTLYIAQQPGWRGIWHALEAGADPNPPLIHVLVQASTTLFGVHPLALRLPSILGGLIAILAMGSMLRRWVRVEFAAAGVLAFMATRGFDYTYDARSYALLLGFAMAALAFWMAAGAAHGSRRIWLCTAMAVSLALGISSNYYGVLAFFPLAAGELLRSREQRRVRPGVWAGLIGGALPLPFYLPLIRHNIAEFAPHAWNRPRVSMVALSYLELVEGVFWLVLLLGVLTTWTAWTGKKRRGGWLVPKPELAAVGVVLLYPVLGFAIALGGAGMISPRCVVPVCCGFGLATALLGQKLFGSSQRRAWTFVAFLVVWVCVREAFCASILLEQRRTFFAIRDQVRYQVPESPILLADSSLALPLYFYSSEAVRSKLVYPIDFAAIHATEKDDSGEQNLWAGRSGVFPFPILSLEALPRFSQPYILIGRPEGWLALALRRRGDVLTLLEDRQQGQWYGVGGVFTPLAHPETRLLLVRPSE